MAKVKSKWVCQNCGYETVSYLGRCPDCGHFGSFVEEIVSFTAKTEALKPSNIIDDKSIVSSIKEIELDEKIRFKSGIDELDRTIGGGFVQGSLILCMFGGSLRDCIGAFLTGFLLYIYVLKKVLCKLN